MKILLAIEVVLLCAQISLADFITECHAPRGDLNYNRKLFAKQYEIANMYYLSFDPKLEKIARQFVSCDHLENGPNHRIDSATRFEDFEVINKYLKKYINTTGVLAFDEVAHPLQTGVTECQLSVSCELDIMSMDGTTYKSQRNSIFIFGPIATIAESDFIHGPPGSKCPNGTTQDKLCSVPIPKKKVVKDHHHHDELDVNVKMRKKEKKMAGKVNFSWFSVAFLVIYLS